MAEGGGKRPVEEVGFVSRAADDHAEGPPRKSVKFAAETKPPQSSVGFKLPAGKAAAGADAAAGAAGATPLVAHANQKVGVPVELDGGYRCTKTGRWIGNGTWVRSPASLRHPIVAGLVAAACSPRLSCRGAETAMDGHRRRQLGRQLLVWHTGRPARGVQTAGAGQSGRQGCCRRGGSWGGVSSGAVARAAQTCNFGVTLHILFRNSDFVRPARHRLRSPAARHGTARAVSPQLLDENCRCGRCSSHLPMRHLRFVPLAYAW